MICAQNGYKTDALADMGFPEDILKIRSRPIDDNFNFDPESVWGVGTYSKDELAIGWVFLQGKVISLRYSDLMLVTKVPKNCQISVKILSENCQLLLLLPP